MDHGAGLHSNVRHHDGRVELFVCGLAKNQGVRDRHSNKFAKFKLTAMPGKLVKAPLIKECLANIECKVVDLIEKHNIVVLEAVAAHEDPAREEKRTVHAVGDGTFIVDGRKLDRKKMMASKLPEGL
jgi:flavin reductase (DIM6/NTAB) family NADH-FMN oxidoreductase RutF